MGENPIDKTICLRGSASGSSSRWMPSSPGGHIQKLLHLRVDEDDLSPRDSRPPLRREPLPGAPGTRPPTRAASPTRRRVFLARRRSVMSHDTPVRRSGRPSFGIDPPRRAKNRRAVGLHNAEYRIECRAVFDRSGGFPLYMLRRPGERAPVNPSNVSGLTDRKAELNRTVFVCFDAIRYHVPGPHSEPRRCSVKRTVPRSPQGSLAPPRRLPSSVAVRRPARRISGRSMLSGSRSRG